MSGPTDPETSDAPVHLVPYLLSRAIGSFNREWMTHLREHGVTVGRWQTLAVLSEYDGARLGQIADMSATKQAVMSRVVDQMERDGLVERRSVAGDGRAVEVWLTPRGRRTFEELLPEANGLVGSALRGLDPATTLVLIDALATIIGNLATEAAVPDEIRR